MSAWELIIVGVEMRAIVVTLIKFRLFSNEDTNNTDSWDRNMKIEIFSIKYIHMRPTWISQILCKCTGETGLKCICVYIHPAPNSSWSEDSRIGPVSGMISDWSQQFFVPVWSWKHLFAAEGSTLFLTWSIAFTYALSLCPSYVLSRSRFCVCLSTDVCRNSGEIILKGFRKIFKRGGRSNFILYCTRIKFSGSISYQYQQY
jgi:hypothetical protein